MVILNNMFPKKDQPKQVLNSEGWKAKYNEQVAAATIELNKKMEKHFDLLNKAPIDSEKIYNFVCKNPKHITNPKLGLIASQYFAVINNARIITNLCYQQYQGNCGKTERCPCIEYLDEDGAYDTFASCVHELAAEMNTKKM
ncbi:MAG: hypothetical protein FWF97_01785 [Alphaproteobacteria bacterium]|nr:hypothetical protein [Alphaproteobacteria bacterium]